MPHDFIDVTKFGTASGTSGNWNCYQPSFTSNAVPNLVWQDTTSNATYSSAGNVLSTRN